MTAVPTSVEPVKTILRTARVVDEPLPDHRPLARQHLEHALGDSGLAARARPSRTAVSGVSSAGLSTTVLPAASAGAKPQPGDRHREVPRHDDPDDAERLGGT